LTVRAISRYNNFQSDLPDHSEQLEYELKKLDDQSKNGSKGYDSGETALLLFFVAWKLTFAFRHQNHPLQREDLFSPAPCYRRKSVIATITLSLK
jgi:hypothetical protein